MPKVTIGTAEVPLTTQELPEFSYSLNEITDPSKLQGSRSTTFNIPATNAARAVLGGTSIAERSDSVHDFRIGDGGVVLFGGKVTPMEWSDDNIRVMAIGDNAGWMGAAKATKLGDVEMGSSGEVSDQYQRDSWMDLNQPDVYPLIDYGAFVDRASTYNVITQQLRPALRVHSVLAKFFQANGYSVASAGRLSRVWKKMYLPNVHDKLSGDAAYLKSKSVEQQLVNTRAYAPLGPVPPDSFPTDPAGIATPGVMGITPIVGTRYQVTIAGTITLTKGSINEPNRILMQVYDDTANTAVLSRIIDIPLGNLVEVITLKGYVIGEFDIVSGRDYYVRFGPTFSASPVSVDVSAWTTRWDMVQAAYIEGITLDLKSCAPKMTVAEVISGITNIERLAVTTDDYTKRVTFSFLSDYLKETTSGIDWRERISGIPVKVQPPIPASFDFEYKEDKGDAYLVEFAKRNDRGFGDTQHISGGLDKPVKIAVPFAATWMDLRLGGLLMPCLKREGPYYQVDHYDYAPRILILGDLAEGDWVHDGQAQTEFPRSYFCGTSRGDTSLSFGSEVVTGNATQGTVATEWRDYLRRAVSPYLRAAVRVYDDEFMGFEFGRPRLVHDGYHQVWCYVQSVKGKRFGEDEVVQGELIPM